MPVPNTAPPALEPSTDERKKRSPRPAAALPPGVEPEFISVLQTCTLLSLGRTKTFQLIANGELETVKAGKKRLVRLRSIREFGRAAA